MPVVMSFLLFSSKLFSGTKGSPSGSWFVMVMADEVVLCCWPVGRFRANRSEEERPIDVTEAISTAQEYFSTTYEA